MKKRLAIVDDQPIVFEYLKNDLQRKFPELEVEIYSSGDKFIEALKKGARYDVVLMDERMHGSNTGPSYTAKAVSIHPETVVIGFSSDERLFSKFLDNGAKYFVSKTEETVKIYEIVKAALNS
jgi:DNA-binding NarL/FixJ family response regulator